MMEKYSLMAKDTYGNIYEILKISDEECVCLDLEQHVIRKIDFNMLYNVRWVPNE